ncbi:MAG: hypothetical protein HC827_07195 [Cyanobacteria bacterium RM1_2_2]|nr:hypothetical protein [Cyanobacteria bacterium RM1_2_2]
MIERMKYFVAVYQEHLEKGVKRELDIKWDADLKNYLERKIQKTFEENIVKSCCRPYAKQYLYFENTSTEELINCQVSFQIFIKTT